MQKDAQEVQRGVRGERLGVIDICEFLCNSSYLLFHLITYLLALPLNFMNYFKAYLKTTFRRRWSVEFVIKNLLNLQSLERLKILG